MRIVEVRKSKIRDLVSNFEKLSNPFPHIVCLTAFAWLAVAFLLRMGLLEVIGIQHPLHGEDLRRYTFLMYSALYACWWGVYLSSRLGTHGVRSLRSLLDVSSAQFMRLPSRMFTSDEIVRGIDEKSRTTISSLSMLVSASFASLALMLQFYERFSMNRDAPASKWEYGMIALAGGVGSLAFLCLLIAADAHDTALNTFPKKDEEDEPFGLKLKQWAYSQAINRRYIGLSLLIAQIACGAAMFAPIYGTLCFAAALTVGYTYWFPSVARSNLVSAWGGMVGCVLIGPLILFWIASAASSDVKGICFVLSACALWALTMPMLNAAISRVAERAADDAEKRAAGVKEKRTLETTIRRYMMAWCCAVAHLLGAVMATAIAVTSEGTWDNFWSVVGHWATFVAGGGAYLGTVGFCLMTNLFPNRPEAAMQLTRLKVPLVTIAAVLVLGERELFGYSQIGATGVAFFAALLSAAVSPRRPSYISRIQVSALVFGVILVWSVQEWILGGMIRGQGLLGHYVCPKWHSLACIGSSATESPHSFLCCGSALVVAAVLWWAAVIGLGLVFLSWVALRRWLNTALPTLLRRDHDGAPRVGLFCLYGVIGIGLATPLYAEGVHQLGLARANLLTSFTMALGVVFFARLQAIRAGYTMNARPETDRRWWESMLFFLDPQRRINEQNWLEAALFLSVALLATTWPEKAFFSLVSFFKRFIV